MSSLAWSPMAWTPTVWLGHLWLGHLWLGHLWPGPRTCEDVWGAMQLLRKRCGCTCGRRICMTIAITLAITTTLRAIYLSVLSISPCYLSLRENKKVLFVRRKYSLSKIRTRGNASTNNGIRIIIQKRSVRGRSLQYNPVRT